MRRLIKNFAMVLPELVIIVNNLSSLIYKFSGSMLPLASTMKNSPGRRSDRTASMRAALVSGPERRAFAPALQPVIGVNAYPSGVEAEVFPLAGKSIDTSDVGEIHLKNVDSLNLHVNHLLSC
jgi:hypothetical protein